jgi:glutathione S-transferase
MLGFKVPDMLNFAHKSHAESKGTANMSQPVLRIFSYLPNPRVWKSLIAAQLCGVEVEVTGASPSELATWLWDYDARELPAAERTEDSPHARIGRRGFSGVIFKTDEFLRAHPFGTVPAAFDPSGNVGIFESNSILRAVARAGAAGRALYGRDGYEASRIDSFLDANLVFGREAQVYLLDMGDMKTHTHARMAAAYEFYLNGVERALGDSAFLVGDQLTIADISFVCDFAQFLREGHYEEQLQAVGLPLISSEGPDIYPRAFEHMLKLSEEPVFAEHMGAYLEQYRKKLGLTRG